MREAVEHIMSPDGRLRITFYRRSDARYEYSVDKFYVDDVPEYDHHMEYWATLHFSGIYDSAETAKCEASVEFPWVTQ